LKKIFLLFFIHFLIVKIVYSQSEIRIGGWQAHLPYNQGWSVTQTPENVIYGTPWSILSIDKADGSSRFISKVEGLSDVGVSQVIYDPFNDQVAVIYDNSNLDFIGREDIVNIPNIKDNTGINGDRRISDIFFAGTNQAFLATGFGIVVLDPSTYNFGTTTITGVPITSIISDGDFVYAGTSEGLYRAPIAMTNLADFTLWSLQGSDVGLPSLYEVNDLEIHNGQIYLGSEDGLYRWDGSNWKLEFESSDEDLVFLQSSDDRLISGWMTGDFTSTLRFFDDNHEWITSGGGCNNLTRGAIRDEQGRIWYAEGFTNIRRSAGYQEGCEVLTYNGPYSQESSDIVIQKGEVLVASGGVSETFGFLFGRNGMFLSSDRRWQNFNEFLDLRLSNPEVLSIFRVAFHPSLPKVYGGTYWAGLLEYDREEDIYQLYDKNNSSLRGTVGDPARERVTGLAFDEEENLWVATYNAPEPLNVMSPDGQWTSFNLVSQGTLSDLIIDELGYKWCPVFGNSGGILVYDSGESIQNISDDQQRFISRANSELTTNQVNCAVVDLDGAVWVGTSEGPVIFDCGPQAFEQLDCPGERRIVFQDSIAAFLLADQDIRVIAVDGGNNKWFGTRNGVFVQSPDGQTQIDHFTEENSPLFDNEIQALAYDGASGEMYIGTNKGILSYRTTTTEGSRRHLSGDVYAFPNPVKPGYLGPIAIKGLVTDALISITNVDGALVSQVRAEGGQAIWNGRDLSGRMVDSGVYLIWSAEPNSFSGPDSYVTKVLVIR